MCGLLGFWQSKNFSAETARARALKMAESIAHRGPDDSGVWMDESIGFALAHRRLSIVDLSTAGHQPMASATGRYVIAFNGEIYNHLEMRNELEFESGNSQVLGGQYLAWRGHSDTETLLAGFEAWGIEETLKRTAGMFAIALWDKQTRTVTLARDRMGEKPLYYGFQNDTFMFGSELKALKAHPAFLGEIDRDVICLYLRHCYIPAPFSIYQGIKKLLAGTYLQLPLEGEINALRALTPKAYWLLSEIVSNGIENPFVGSDAEAVAALDAQLKQAIRSQVVADVPLGAFLSGGVDSSAVVALMQSQSVRPVKTFTIGFEEQGYNEAEYARVVARHLGTDHTDIVVSSTDAMNVIPKLGKIYDEPFADSSQIPTFLVSQLARQQVTVSLSGDGGDELFCGYNRYLLADQWGQIAKVPFSVRKVAGRLMHSVPSSVWSVLFNQSVKLKTLPDNMAEKLVKLATRLKAVDGTNELYYSLVSEINQPETLVLDAKEPPSWLTDVGIGLDFNDDRQHMMYLDAMTYLPDDILVKVDRAAMANSLETRVPFLDYHVIELAASLPMSMKVRDGKSKWLLREVLYQYVPKNLIERPKAGFGIPLNDWLGGPLRAWAEVLLDETRLQREGYFNVVLVRELWRKQLLGIANNKSLIWSVLMFQVWLEEQ